MSTFSSLYTNVELNWNHTRKYCLFPACVLTARVWSLKIPWVWIIICLNSLDDTDDDDDDDNDYDGDEDGTADEDVCVCLCVCELPRMLHLGKCTCA